jgi:hypothetical protein
VKQADLLHAGEQELEKVRNDCKSAVMFSILYYFFFFSLQLKGGNFDIASKLFT